MATINFLSSAIDPETAKKVNTQELDILGQMIVDAVEEGGVDVALIFDLSGVTKDGGIIAW